MPKGSRGSAAAGAALRRSTGGGKNWSGSLGPGLFWILLAGFLSGGSLTSSEVTAFLREREACRRKVPRRLEPAHTFCSVIR